MMWPKKETHILSFISRKWRSQRQQRFTALSLQIIAQLSRKLSASSNFNDTRYSQVGYKQSDQVWWNVVKDWIVNLHFGDDFTLCE